MASIPFYVSFIAPVNSINSQALLGIISQKIFNNQGVKFNELHLCLSTPGGSVEHGISVYNTLKALPIKIITYNIGQINSIGNVIFLAGEERYASSVSSFMFHGVGFDVTQMRFEEKNLKERLEHIKNDLSYPT